jgi:hypothetical protein
MGPANEQAPKERIWEKLAEQRDWHWTLTSFTVEAWGPNRGFLLSS